MSRTARVERRTGESAVVVELDLDGSGRSSVSTGVPFYDHMLASLAKHALLDLDVEAKGDVDVDAHHTVEDVAIVLGQALREALGDKVGIRRFGDALVPLDECLVQCPGARSACTPVSRRARPTSSSAARTPVR
jgi:imidazoleglycerol-phosphate dehydratase